MDGGIGDEGVFPLYFKFSVDIFFSDMQSIYIQ